MSETQTIERLAYRVNEAAAAIGISRALCYELIAAKRLPHIRVGTSIRIPRQALEAWIARQLDEQIPASLRA
jgi:excisionase family DNA binding protein